MAGIGVALLIALGTWQVQRAAWKDGLQAALDARLAEPAVALPAATDAPEAWIGRRVVVAGTFDHAREMTVLLAAVDGRSGYRVVTPLHRPDGTALLVDRGWVPLDRRDPATRAEGQVAGPITLEGVVGAGGRRGWLTPEDEPSTGTWFTVDPAAMAAATGIAAPPIVIEAARGTGPALPEGGQTVTTLRNEHRGYAATWYALAAVLAVVYVVFLRSERRSRAP
jgi:surfeit locus 1 family protein